MSKSSPSSGLRRERTIASKQWAAGRLCWPSVVELARLGVPFVTALGVGARLEAAGVAPDKITELDWHESIDLGALRFTATPAQHFSGRSLGDRNKTLWASWVIES